MRFASGNAYKRGDVAAQVQQRVHFHDSLALAELGPREQLQAQVDGGRVQRVETLIEIHADRIAGIQGPRDANQDLGEIGIDPPVARLVGVGQGGARDVAAESHVVELSAKRTQARFDIAQAFAVGQLGERHREELIPAGEAAQPAIPVVAAYAASEFTIRKEVDQLGEHGAAEVHEPLSTASEVVPVVPRRSNRGKEKTALSHAGTVSCRPSLSR